jgi:AbrB family looped-hinge helix DNA binding protein
MELTTKLSSKGQIVLPKAVRDANGWTTGTELEVIDRGNEVVLRPKSGRDDRFPPISMEEFFARIPKYHGPPITDDLIEQAILKEATRRWHAKGD